ncbi:uncharacterized protein [Paramormyrops kingsleyae]|uniref:uncharacterized protein n=1 Tax=Paramormyrops kingsleyae TaxID=1676925 RepID=UPI003B96FC7F
MLGKVWGLFCCNKRKHSDQTSSGKSNCKVKRICSAETVSTVSQAKDGGDGGSEVRQRGEEKAVAEEGVRALECQVHPDTENTDMSLNEFTLDDLVTFTDQGESSVTRGYLLAKQRTGMVHEEGQEAGAGHVNDTAEDFKLERFCKHHKSPGMNEVLEMMRDGVSLRHVIEVHKLEAEPELNSQMESELHRILKKRKASSDNYISDGSLIRNPTESYMVMVPQNGSALKSCPGQNYLHQEEGNGQE